MRHHRLLSCLLTGALLGDSSAIAAAPADASAPASGHWIRVASPSAPKVLSVLANTQWRLVEFQSMEDRQGTQRPEAPSRYVLRLDSDGTATLWLNCNRVTGTWVAQPGAKADSGRFEFGHIQTRAAPCPTPGMEKDILRQAGYVRSFLLKQGRLHLGLMADGGVYVWARDSTAPTVTAQSTSAASAAATAKPAPGPAAAPVARTSSAPAVAAAAAAAQSTPPSTPPPPPPVQPPAAPTLAGWQVLTRVNLREQPSTQSRVLALLTPGTRLVRGECQPAEGREWCRVKVQPGGGEGFVAAEYLKPTAGPSANPAVPAPAKTTAR